MAVEFEDYSIRVTEALEECAVQFLEEAASEIESQAKRNSDFAPRSLKPDWKHIVDEGKKEATVGHPKELALWMEKGTGEYAIGGDGRKGYWIYIEGQGSSAGNNSKSYATLEEAKKAMRFLREEKGLPAHITKGHRPMRMLEGAFESKKSAIINRAKQLFEEGMS